MNRRRWVVIVTVVPALSLFALLAWALIQSGGNPGGLGVNERLGEKPTVSRPAPDFTLTALDRSRLSLASLRGRVVMLDFWSSWCPPCRAEAPVLSQVYRDYADRSVEFVGVAIWDQDQDIRQFAEEFTILYPVVIDVQGRVALDYGVSGIPEKFFVDESGRVARSFTGPMSPEALRSILDELLADAEQTTGAQS